jgi:hypothetical protein
VSREATSTRPPTRSIALAISATSVASSTTCFPLDFDYVWQSSINKAREHLLRATWLLADLDLEGRKDVPSTVMGTTS